jgi:hypothetical protein
MTTAIEILERRTAEANARIKAFWTANPDLLALAKQTRELFGEGVTCTHIGPIGSLSTTGYVVAADSAPIRQDSPRKGKGGSGVVTKWVSR